jgi:hypothetical protein
LQKLIRKAKADPKVSAVFSGCVIFRKLYHLIWELLFISLSIQLSPKMFIPDLNKIKEKTNFHNNLNNKIIRIPQYKQVPSKEKKIITLLALFALLLSRL